MTPVVPDVLVVPHRLRWLVGAAIGAVVAWQSWDASSLGEPNRRWALIAVLVLAVGIGELLPDACAALADPGRLTGVLVVSLAAIYGCVPETDHISDVALIMVAGLVVELVSRRTMPIAWFAACTGLVMWAGIYGATGRERAIVGTLFAFWPVVLVAAAFRMVPRMRRTSPTIRLTVAGVGGMASLVVSRTGALQYGIRPAAVAAAIAAAASIVAAAILVRIASTEPSGRP